MWSAEFLGDQVEILGVDIAIDHYTHFFRVFFFLKLSESNKKMS